MIKYPSINQFRNVIKSVEQKTRWVGFDENGEPKFNRDVELPTLKFRGTTKLHGTNAGIVKNIETGEITFQSRERELSLLQDNAGFMLYMSSKTDVINHLIDTIVSEYTCIDKPTKVAVFGEYCAGNIQKGVALSQLPEKMFVIFGVRYCYPATEDEQNNDIWIDLDKVKHITSPEDRIYNILNFPTVEIDIDFNKPHEVQNKIIDMTIAVEDECPVGKAFGVSGVGEGLVFQCITPGWKSSAFWFKSKGEKYSISKVKTISSVDVEAINSLNAFVDSVVTENRLEWALNNMINEKLLPFEMKSMGDFLRVLHADILKEELDTIVANQLDPKKLGAPIANKARKWYIAKLDESIGLK